MGGKIIFVYVYIIFLGKVRIQGIGTPHNLGP
jgi:hypothetical protein